MGSCGSSYAIVAAAAMASTVSNEFGTQAVLLSTQQIIACSQAYGNSGCNSGSYLWSWDYA